MAHQVMGVDGKPRTRQSHHEKLSAAPRRAFLFFFFFCFLRAETKQEAREINVQEPQQDDDHDNTLIVSRHVQKHASR